jgi:hypothetical protein
MTARWASTMDATNAVWRETQVWVLHLTGEGPATLRRNRQAVLDALAARPTPGPGRGRRTRVLEGAGWRKLEKKRIPRRRLPLRKARVLAALVLIASLIGVAAFPAPTQSQTGGITLLPLQTMTLTWNQVLTSSKDGKPAVIAGQLRIPRIGTGRCPAVVLLGGSFGLELREERWAEELTGLGIATFLLDSLTGRGLTQTATDQAQLNPWAQVVDAYRALELLGSHPSIDPARIALMGFSRGGIVTLYASLLRFQRPYGPPSLEFAAYVPFYPTGSVGPERTFSCTRILAPTTDSTIRPCRPPGGYPRSRTRAAACGKSDHSEGS